MIVLLAAAALFAQEPAETTQLRRLMAATPLLPHRLTQLQTKPAAPIEMASSVAYDSSGLLYILQRGKASDPVIVTKPDGTVVRSWGRGLYKIPHSIRIDPQGNVWTVDAGDSTIRKYTKDGKELMKISVSLPEKPRSEFCGTADITFAPDGHFYVADGYQNTRVLEFDANGKQIREWGTPGTGPGQMDHPHGIAIDRNQVIYVADRENGRIQRFDRKGKYLGEWNGLGKTFCLKITPGGEIWIGTQPRNVPNGAEGWLVKLDPKTGKPLGRIDTFGHSVDVSPKGEVVTGRRPGSVLVFQP